MAISVSDILHLPYNPDLTEGGIAYALRCLTHSFDLADHSFYDRLRRMVASAAVELAFRRHLSGLEIPYEGIKANTFSEPERYDVSLGGRRCEIKAFFISNHRQITAIKDHPEILLDVPGLVPSDQHAGEGHKGNDLYLFAFVTGQIATSQDELKKAIQTGQPHYLVHLMDQEWRRPRNWNPLGPLMIKSESDEQMFVQIHGQDADRGFVTSTCHLPPHTKFVVNDPFYSLAAVHVRHPLNSRLGIQGSGRATHVIQPMDWGNIWVHGMGIYFVGFISYQDFRRCAKPIPANSPVFQYHRTRVKSLSVPISQLNPLSHLFDMVREWEKGKDT
jgi:hypothetical protein